MVLNSGSTVTSSAGSRYCLRPQMIDRELFFGVIRSSGACPGTSVRHGSGATASRIAGLISLNSATIPLVSGSSDTRKVTWEVCPCKGSTSTVIQCNVGGVEAELGARHLQCGNHLRFSQRLRSAGLKLFVAEVVTTSRMPPRAVT